jgi:hypothetical protein
MLFHGPNDAPSLRGKFWRAAFMWKGPAISYAQSPRHHSSK